MKPLVILSVAAGIAFQVMPLPAADVLHYWNFDTQEAGAPVDLIGGVPTSLVGAPDLGTHADFGEAYAGSGGSLNSTLGGGDFLSADVYDDGAGTATEAVRSSQTTFSALSTRRMGSGSRSSSMWVAAAGRRRSSSMAHRRGATISRCSPGRSSRPWIC